MHFEETKHFHISFFGGLTQFSVFLSEVYDYQLNFLLNRKNKFLQSVVYLCCMTQFSICSLVKTAMKHKIIEIEQSNYNTPFSFSETVFFLPEASVFID